MSDEAAREATALRVVMDASHLRGHVAVAVRVSGDGRWELAAGALEAPLAPEEGEPTFTERREGQGVVYWFTACDDLECLLPFCVVRRERWSNGRSFELHGQFCAPRAVLG